MEQNINVRREEKEKKNKEKKRKEMFSKVVGVLVQAVLTPIMVLFAVVINIICAIFFPFVWWKFLMEKVKHWWKRLITTINPVFWAN